MKIQIYKILRNNVELITNLIYRKASKNNANLGIVGSLIKIGFDRINKIIRWFYFGIIVTIITYIVSIGKVIEEIFIKIFNIIQIIGKYIIELIIKIIGPLSENIINNIWLLFLGICFLSLFIIFYKILNYYIKKRKELKKEKELFKNELIEKLNEQDNVIKNQIIKMQEIEKRNIDLNEIIGVNINKNEKERNIKKIYLGGKLVEVDVSKIKI